MKKNYFVVVSLLIGVTLFACSKKEKPAEGTSQNQVIQTPIAAQPPETSAPSLAPTAEPKPPGLEGQVLQVTSADTLVVKVGSKKVHVKLYGVVLPKNKSAIVKSAKKFTSNMVMGKTVFVEDRKKTKKQSIAMLNLVGGTNLNHELVREGYCSWDQKSARDEYAKQLQDQAKEAKKGMWAEKAKKPAKSSHKKKKKKV